MLAIYSHSHHRINGMGTQTGQTEQHEKSDFFFAFHSDKIYFLLNNLTSFLKEPLGYHTHSGKPVILNRDIKAFIHNKKKSW